MMSDVQKLNEVALLVQFEGDDIREQWLLDRNVIRIGRLPDNDIVVSDRWVSRYHAEIRREGGQYYLHDLDSKNGTIVNGRLLTAPHCLVDGDAISVAPLHILTFVDYAATAPLPGQKSSAALDLDAETRGVWIWGRLLDPPLSQVQFDFLAALTRDPGRVCSREDLVRAVWPAEDPSGISDEAINALVHRLRSRLRQVAPEHEFIVTVRGFGFRIDLPAG